MIAATLVQPWSAFFKPKMFTTRTHNPISSDNTTKEWHIENIYCYCSKFIIAMFILHIPNNSIVLIYFNSRIGFPWNDRNLKPWTSTVVDPAINITIGKDCIWTRHLCCPGATVAVIISRLLSIRGQVGFVPDNDPYNWLWKPRSPELKWKLTSDCVVPQYFRSINSPRITRYSQMTTITYFFALKQSTLHWAVYLSSRILLYGIRLLIIVCGWWFEKQIQCI